MNSQWTIIADDFTGAGDSAVQFGSPRSPVRLLLETGGKPSRGKRPAAIVFDTDSRFLDAEAAYARVAAAVGGLRKAGIDHLFKKIDSTLRGNPAAEMAAALDAGGYRFAVVAPAAPRNKRTVSGGICYVAGTPLGETAVARDPFTPVTESRVSKILEARFPGAVRELCLSAVRSPGALRAELDAGLSAGARVFVADAETVDDLKAVASLRDRDGILFVGSSGLAEALAEKDSAARPILPRIPRGRALFVIGSVTPTSAAQCGSLVRVGQAFELVVRSAAVLSDPAAEKRRLLESLEAAPPRRALLVRTTGSDTPGSADLADKSAGVAISRFLGELALEVARLRRIRFLFASGGDTAARIAKAFGTSSIDFFSEILPGLPFGFFRSAALGRRVYFVSKSGGFGDQNAMADSLAMVSPAPTRSKELKA